MRLRMCLSLHSPLPQPIELQLTMHFLNHSQGLHHCIITQTLLLLTVTREQGSSRSNSGRCPALDALPSLSLRHSHSVRRRVASAATARKDGMVVVVVEIVEHEVGVPVAEWHGDCGRATAATAALLVVAVADTAESDAERLVGLCLLLPLFFQLGSSTRRIRRHVEVQDADR